MQKNLTLVQRVIATLIYIIVFIGITRYFSESYEFLFDSQNNYNQIFVSVALLLIFGSYIAEPFFTKPTDVLVNVTSIFLFLLSINKPEEFVGYYLIAIISAILILVTVILILSSLVWKKTKLQELSMEFLVMIGKSKVAFSVIYIASLVSYFKDTPIAFGFFFTFWVIFITGFVVENLILKIGDIIKHFYGEDKNIFYVGQAIGYENPFVFRVEVDNNKTKAFVTTGDLVRISLKGESDVFGVVVDQKILLNRKWLTVYLLRQEGDFIRASSFLNSSYSNFFSNAYTVNKVEVADLKSELKEIIEANELYKKRNNFIGYIDSGSDINCIRFYILPNITDEPVVEGTIVSSVINKKDVLFQVINGNTKKEELEHYDSHSFISVLARKLGEYNIKNKEIISARWLPEMYAPVFSLKKETYSCIPTSIGSLPNTSYPVEVKNFNELVTHNTAILGILGIGKSCLSFELIQKTISNTNTKIICIDITNEYAKELVNYIDENLIDKDELGSDFLVDLKTASARTGSDRNPNEWGNKKHYEAKIQERIETFYADTNKRILVMNPDWHAVVETSQKFNITHCEDLSVTQKTRVISERTFLVAKTTWDTLDEQERRELKARFLLVFEEAHSLIPEWNSAANEGDQSAANGTAKVILQGRKYGLGSFVVTQRTANISKSILNQCNTIFALRVFDDTGKQFLENYIGSDYANTLPTLEERHAIIIGKALKLKQPVIVSLNDRKDVIVKKIETKSGK